jgi:hypothetical protein
LGRDVVEEKTCPPGWIVVGENVGKGKDVPQGDGAWEKSVSRKKVGSGRGWGLGKDMDWGKKGSLGRRWAQGKDIPLAVDVSLGRWG